MGHELHPIVKEVATLLVSEKKTAKPPLTFSEEHPDIIHEKLTALAATNMPDFRIAVRDLTIFSGYLRAEKKSPAAAETLIEVLGNHPEVIRIANEAQLEQMGDAREKIGDNFSKFVNSRSPAEEEIPTSEPPMSVAQLLRSLSKK